MFRTKLLWLTNIMIGLRLDRGFPNIISLISIGLWRHHWLGKSILDLYQFNLAIYTNLISKMNKNHFFWRSQALFHNNQVDSKSDYTFLYTYACHEITSLIVLIRSFQNSHFTDKSTFKIRFLCANSHILADMKNVMNLVICFRFRGKPLTSQILESETRLRKMY